MSTPTTTPELVPAEPSASAPPPVHHIPTHLNLLTKLVIMPLMGLSTAFFGCISLVCGVWDKSGRQQHLVARAWAKSLILLSLSPVEVIGADKLRHAPVGVYMPPII
jgi:1-acyl-sn-glycerol-3-phosphate acyltransferase